MLTAAYGTRMRRLFMKQYRHPADPLGQGGVKKAAAPDA